MSTKNDNTNKSDETKPVDEFLSIIYGETYKLVTSNYVFIWEEPKIKRQYKYGKNGTLLAINGAKLIKEKIDEVIELRDNTTTKIIGYAVFLKGQLKEIYSVNSSQTPMYKINIMVITETKTLGVGKLKAKYYSKHRPDIVITYEDKVLQGRFNEKGEMLYFTASR